jgi:hypothetical protein
MRKTATGTSNLLREAYGENTWLRGMKNACIFDSTESWYVKIKKNKTRRQKNRHGWHVPPNQAANQQFYIQDLTNLRERRHICGVRVRLHTSTQSDLASYSPRDVFPFRKLKSSLKGTHFQSSEDLHKKMAELLRAVSQNDVRCFEA